MNGKRSKELRRKAEALTVGKEYCEYQRSKPNPKQGWNTSPIIVKPATTRGVLKTLKKAAKK
jgi:hypothetical protein